MTCPDFVVIGGMKCGTTTLAEQLGSQEGIFITDPKEPNFFSDEENFDRGLNWYASLFSDAAPGDLLGEASTHYTKWPDLPKAPQRLFEHAPDAKLIYMVRDPIKRAVSHVRHAWTEREIGDDLEAAARSVDAFWQYGLYHRQLQNWLHHYPEERILVVALERLNAAPHEEFERVLRFLGQEGRWVDDHGDQNQGAERSRKLPLHDVLIDSPVATALRRTLIPKSWRTKMREARQLSSVEISDQAKARWAELLSDDIAAFGALFGIEGLNPQNFKERVLAQQLTFAQTSDS